MIPIPEQVINFIRDKGYVIITTLDENGCPHSACKGFIKIDRAGQFFIMDLYKQRTYANLLRNPVISATIADEHQFTGYCLKGRAKIIWEKSLTPSVFKAWENRLTHRLTRRVLNLMSGGPASPSYAEEAMPPPQYLLVMEVEEIVDLAPREIDPCRS